MDFSMDIIWNRTSKGDTTLQWIHQPPFWEGAGQASPLADICREASGAFSRGDWKSCIETHDRALAAFDGITSPTRADRFYRWFAVAGKASAELRLAQAGSLDWEAAWTTTERAMGADFKGLSRPLELTLEWAKTAVLVGATSGHWAETTAILKFLNDISCAIMMKMSINEDEQLYFMNTYKHTAETFVLKMRDAYTIKLESSPASALAWIRTLQQLIETHGTTNPYVRDLLHHALTQNGDKDAALQLAQEMVEWSARNAPDFRDSWSRRVVSSAPG